MWSVNSRNLSLAWCSTWSREMTVFPSLRLFLRFHRAQIIIEKRVGSLFSAKTQPVRSIKVVACRRLSWFHKGTLFHRSDSFEQWNRAWHTSSLACWQLLHVLLVMIFRLTKFVLVGKEFFVALQTKFLTLLGTGKLQIA